MAYLLLITSSVVIGLGLILLLAGLILKFTATPPVAESKNNGILALLIVGGILLFVGIIMLILNFVL